MKLRILLVVALLTTIGSACSSAVNSEYLKQAQADALSRVAVKYAEVGQKAKAEQIFAQALESANSIKDDKQSKAYALTQLAKKYVEAGQYDQAFRVVKTIDPLFDSSKADALAKIGDRATQAEPVARASQILAQALEIAKSIEAENLKAEALGEIATQYAAIGQAEKASEILDQALGSAKKVGVTGNLCRLVSCTFPI